MIVLDWNHAFSRTAFQILPQGGLLETKIGSYIDAGEPAGFHEWEFRTIVCMKFTNQKIEKKMAELKDQEQAWIIITREGSGTWA